MSGWWPPLALALMVAAILLAGRQPACARLFRFLPVPFWCYALPMAAVSMGVIPAGHPAYRPLASWLLPISLSFLLLGVDLPAVARSGGRALLAAAFGALGIIVGTSLSVWALQAWLPAEAWKGAGALSGTWTGGSLNLLALREVLKIPEEIFAPLIVVDTIIAYGWMALLVTGSGIQDRLDRWLLASSNQVGLPPPSRFAGPEPPRTRPMPPVEASAPIQEEAGSRPRVVPLLCGTLLSIGLAYGSWLLAAAMPHENLISSRMGWTVVILTTLALGLSCIPVVRAIGRHGTTPGYPLLYLVLAATGAQASLNALWASPVWLVVGVGTVTFHGLILLQVGRWLRLPLGLLATASQANIGGFVSAPLVGAVYHRTLAPVGLLLAVGGSAVGTYAGVLAAWLARMLLASG